MRLCHSTTVMLATLTGCSVLSVGCGAQTHTMALDPCQYRSDSGARAVWKPGEPSPPVEAARGPALRFHCPFTVYDRRTAWDRELRADLSAFDRLKVKLRVTNPAAVAYITLYLRSGAGWYGASFTPKSADWHFVDLMRSQFVGEGQPTGWNAVDGLRFSVWKGAASDTDVLLGGIWAASSAIAVIDGASFLPTGHPDRASAVEAASRTARFLSKIGLDYGTIGQSDILGGALKGKRIVILPFCPDVPEAVVQQVRQWVAQGGHLIAFYALNPALADLLGLSVVRYAARDYPGQYSTIRFKTRALVGAPAEVSQSSWNIYVVRPASESTRVLAEWCDSKGASTGFPAVTEGPAGIYMSHILLDDDPERKTLMLLAFVGHLWPDAWETAATRSVEGIGRLLPRLSDFRSAVSEVTSSSKRSGRLVPRKELSAGARFRKLALTALRDRRYADAVRYSSGANRFLTKALLRALPSRHPEFRAVWCHSAFGVEGMTWDEACRTLRRNGFTEVIPNMLWGGLAFYPSDLLPVDPSVRQRGDQIEACVQAAHRHGLKVHVWKVNWNLQTAPRQFVEDMRRQGRTQVGRGGEPVDWLCPSHPENRALERDSMLEVVRRYPIDGIHFDYIRYPHENACFCSGCRQRFQQQTGIQVANWPDDVVSGPQAAAFRQWRCDQITSLVAEVSREAHRIRPGILVSAAVFSDYPACKDYVGQDWLEWVKNGYLDFVCPMDYTPDSARFEAVVRRQMDLVANRIPLYPGIGATSPEVLPPLTVAEQILVARRCGANGFTIFNYDAGLARDVLPSLSLGVTAQR
ncbi:MAG: family 10 glycosylhydrolase [Armatimonadota bacterium]